MKNSTFLIILSASGAITAASLDSIPLAIITAAALLAAGLFALAEKP